MRLLPGCARIRRGAGKRRSLTFLSHNEMHEVSDTPSISRRTSGKASYLRLVKRSDLSKVIRFQGEEGKVWSTIRFRQMKLLLPRSWARYHLEYRTTAPMFVSALCTYAPRRSSEWILQAPE